MQAFLAQQVMGDKSKQFEPIRQVLGNLGSHDPIVLSHALSRMTEGKNAEGFYKSAGVTDPAQMERLAMLARDARQGAFDHLSRSYHHSGSAVESDAYRRFFYDSLGGQAGFRTEGRTEEQARALMDRGGRMFAATGGERAGGADRVFMDLKDGQSRLVLRADETVTALNEIYQRLGEIRADAIGFFQPLKLGISNAVIGTVEKGVNAVSGNPGAGRQSVDINVRHQGLEGLGDKARQDMKDGVEGVARKVVSDAVNDKWAAQPGELRRQITANSAGNR